MPRHTREDTIMRQTGNMVRIVRPGIVRGFADMVRSLNEQPLQDAQRWALLSEYILSQEPDYMKPAGTTRVTPLNLTDRQRELLLDLIEAEQETAHDQEVQDFLNFMEQALHDPCAP